METPAVVDTPKLLNNRTPPSNTSPNIINQIPSASKGNLAEMKKPSPTNSNQSPNSATSSPLSFNAFLKSSTNESSFLDRLNNDVTLRIDKVMDSIEVYSDLSSNTEKHNDNGSQEKETEKEKENENDNPIINSVNQNILKNLEEYTFNNESNENKGSEQINTIQDLLETSNFYKVPLELFEIKDLSERRYFEVFFYEFSQILLPLVPDILLNPVRDILILYSLRKKYLYYSILASGARYSYKQTSLDDDQYWCSKYMKKSLEMLKDLMIVKNFNPTTKNQLKIKQVSKMIEPLLLTILMLTSDNASSMNQSWRGHLKGAKDLLSKVFIQNLFNKSQVLIFCKMWFTSFEILAALTGTIGGTLIQEVELSKLVLDVDNVEEVNSMKLIKLITDEGFNLLFGFHLSLTKPLISLVEALRIFGKGSEDEKLFLGNSIFDLITQFNETKKLVMISESGIIPQDHKWNPLNEQSFEKNKYKHFISSYKNLNTNEITSILWLDICHQSYSDACLLTCLTRILNVPKEHACVQASVKKLLTRVHFLDKSFELFTIDSAKIEHSKSFNLMLLQWPMFVAGINCNSRDDIYQIDTFFRYLIQLGSGSARYSLDRIKKVWNNESNVDDVDVVTY